MHTPELEQTPTDDHRPSFTIGGVAAIITAKATHSWVKDYDHDPFHDDTAITNELNDYTAKIDQYQALHNDNPSPQDVKQAIHTMKADDTLPDHLRSAAYDAQTHLNSPSPLETTIAEHSDHNVHRAVETIQTASTTYQDQLLHERQNDDAYEIGVTAALGITAGIIAGATTHYLS